MIRLIRKQDQLYDLDHCEKLLMSFVVDQTVINPENFGEKSVDTFFDCGGKYHHFSVHGECTKPKPSRPTAYNSTDLKLKR